jgi:hypothetical protein
MKMDLKNAKVKIPGAKRSVALTTESGSAHPDLRTKAGRAWKSRQGNMKHRTIPAQGNVHAANLDGISDAARDELHTLSRSVKIAEMHLRDFASRISPRMKARDFQNLRDELHKEADRLFYVLYPRADVGAGQ